MELKKPERKKGIIAVFDREGKKYYKPSQLADGAYNQGLDDMEAYYKGSELSKDEIKKIFIDMFGVYPDHRGCSELEENIDRFCQALIDARDKKRRVG